MDKYLQEYNKWISTAGIDSNLLLELKNIKDNFEEIKERFYKELEFGTGGLRGVIGAGTNRMNLYTVRKTTLGLANYILSKSKEDRDKGVVIAYDSREYSKEFAEEAAKVLATNNIKVYLFNELMPTPLLSFAVRYIKAYAGIVITASHNPAEYNGYKIYNQYGGQITEKMAAEIYNLINKIDNILEYEVVSFDDAISKNQIIYIGEEIVKEYISQVEGILLNKSLIKEQGNKLKIIYTPLHGTGNKPVKKLLNSIGFTNLHVVSEQEKPDYKFSTVKAPNPEEREVFNLAIKLGIEQDADIIMGTDPDADRLGVLVKKDREYIALNGNQLGALILNYLLEEKAHKRLLTNNMVLIKTIVTSEFGKTIADKYKIQTVNTLTGFKYIGEKIKEFEKIDAHFLFGYEESYGYLVGDFVRDKDAVQITAIVAEMSLVYKIKGKTLIDILEELYQEHGYYMEDLYSLTLKGIDGNKRINDIVALFRQQPPKEINGIEVEWIEDYLTHKRINLIDGREELIDLPTSNVIKLILKDNSWVAVRPSGTEPKIKYYFGVVSANYTESVNKLNRLKEEIISYSNSNQNS